MNACSFLIYNFIGAPTAALHYMLANNVCYTNTQCEIHNLQLHINNRKKYRDGKLRPGRQCTAIKRHKQ